MENNARPFPPVRRRRRRSNARAIALLLAIVLTFGVAVGGTIAWLTDETEDVVNTFSTSDINITLEETKGDLKDGKREFKMIPGWTIEKDPKVTVLANSEACYLFVKVQKTTGFDTYMTYTMVDGWTLVDGETDVYYREVAASDSNQEFYILKENKLTVSSDVTKEMMEAIEAGTAARPEMTFTAYACQLYKTNGEKFEPAEAWAKINPPANS